MPRAVTPELPPDWPFSATWTATTRYACRALREANRRQDPAFRAILKARWAEMPPPDREGSTMGRLLTAVPSATPVSVDVPEDVAAELAELYAYMQEHPEFTGQAVFTKDDDKGEPTNEPNPDAAVTFLAQAKEWARTQNPVLEVRKSPSRTLPDHVIRFQIRPPLTPEEVAANAAKNKEAAAKREAAKAKAGKAK